MLIEYVSKRFGAKALALITHANDIIADYGRQGYVLTLRQLYYQFVARDLIPNTMKSYKMLGNVINDGRLAGMISWTAIEDRTRNLSTLPAWDSPQSIIESCASQYREDKWKDQPNRVEVWIEKEALEGVFERVCNELQVPFLCCRGYTSQSEMWGAGRRLKRYRDGGQQPVILHFGDHDPSGIDMTRDIQERLVLFSEGPVALIRVALNMDQVEEYQPPPNPAKATDSRFQSYLNEYGDESWELDALDPATLSNLVREHVKPYRIEKTWKASKFQEEEGKSVLADIANDFDNVKEFLRGDV